MPQKRKGPRLWLYRREGRASVWMIRDDKLFFSTGLVADQTAKAENALKAYIKTGVRPAQQKSKSPADKPGTIYFITTDEVPDYPVKIGIAYKALWARLRDLQGACPFRLIVLRSFDGSLRGELALHSKFGDGRLQGEWFRRTRELMDFIRSLAEEAA